MTGRRLGRGVALVGAGMSKFGAFPGKNTRELFVEAYQEMTASLDKGFDPAAVEAALRESHRRLRFDIRAEDSR